MVAIQCFRDLTFPIDRDRRSCVRKVRFSSGVCRILVQRLGSFAGFIIQALLFGSVHLASPLHAMVGYFGGIVLGMVSVYCRSLKVSIVLYAGANGIRAAASPHVA